MAKIETREELSLVILALSDYRTRRKITLEPKAYETLKEIEERLTKELTQILKGPSNG